MPFRTLRIKERLGFQPLGELPVDREKHTISGVKLLGWESRNNSGKRRYAESCGKAPSIDCYRGAVSNIDHGSKTVASRFARVIPESVEARADGIYGTLKYNPHLPLTEAILWFVEHDPAALGMSHDADAKVETQRDGTQLITEIVHVNSVDIVSDPATTKGFFESMEPISSLSPGESGGPGDFKMQLADLVKSAFSDPNMTNEKVAELVKHLLKAHKAVDDGEEAEEPVAAKGGKTEESVQPDLKAQLAEALKLLDGYKVAEAHAKRKDAARKLCESVGLPKHAITETFLNDLAAKDDEKAVKESIEDRRLAITGSATRKPTSAPAGGTPKPPSLDDFCKQLTTVQ